MKEPKTEELKLSNIPAMTVDRLVDTLAEAYTAVIRGGVPLRTVPSVMLWGPPGVGKSQAVRQLAQKAISSLTKEERALFLNNFTGRIVPFCDGVLAGDEHCLNLLEDAGLQTQASWTEQDSGTESDQDRWEILKAAVLSLW